MYRVLIIEDDPSAAEALRAMLQRRPMRDKLSIEFADPGELSELSSDYPDIAMVDIELGRGRESGIELVRRLFPESSGTQVIYATGHIEYCTDVYQTEHVSFLIKPIDQDKLDFAVGKAIRNIDSRKRDVLTVKIGSSVRVIPSRSIEYVESKLRKVRIHLVDGEAVETYATLGDIEERLPDYFLRCHKSYLANMYLITEIGGGSLLMRSGSVVPVSQSQRRRARERFARFIELPQRG